MQILIKDGTIVTHERTFSADILINKGKIEHISQNIEVTDRIEKVIDASNRYVFPGGIDPHVHFSLKTPAGNSADDFYTGSKAAIHGGNTSIIDFVTPDKGQSLVESLYVRLKEAENCLTNKFFHVSPVEWTNNTEEEIKECVRLGIKSFKVYMAYKNTIGLQDIELEKVIQAVSKAGGILTVHAEMGDDIERLREKYASEKNLSPVYHAKSRPDYTESIAVKKIIEMAAKYDCPLYIVHVSARSSIEIIKNAQNQGQKVFAEVTPHHLLLDEKMYLGDFVSSAPFVLSPPLRTKKDNDSLWMALENNILQTTGSDHCTFTMEQKKYGINDFRLIPNGAGGVEHRLALLFSYGVLTNKLGLNRFVNITSTNAAKIFGLYPKKGNIEIGSDADLLVWNPIAERIISAKTHYQNCDINIYEGFKTIGAPEYVLINGKIVKSH